MVGDIAENLHSSMQGSKLHFGGGVLTQLDPSALCWRDLPCRASPSLKVPRQHDHAQVKITVRFGDLMLQCGDLMLHLTFAGVIGHGG